jgi:hypothetical protein
VLALPAPDTQLPPVSVTDVSMAGDPGGAALAIAGTGWQVSSPTPTTIASWADSNGIWHDSAGLQPVPGLVPTGDTALASGAGFTDGGGNFEHPIYLAETWQPDQGPLCTSSYGMAVARSPDGGMSYAAPVTIASPGLSSTFSQPSIASTGAFASQTVWLAYTETDWAQACDTGSGSTQTVQLAVSNDGGLSYVDVPSSHFSSGAGASAPAIAADTSDGAVYIAWWNATLSKIQVERCTESGLNVGCGPTMTAATGVGDPGSLGSVKVSAAPAIAWANQRLVIAWTQRGTDGSLDVDTTTLQTSGTFTAPAPIAGAAHIDEYAPALSATPGGRVDLAYLDDSGGGGTARAFTASSNTTLDTGEDWPPAPAVQTAPTPATPGPGAPPVASPPAIASGTAQTPPVATEPTIVAWSDGTAGGAYTSRIAHGTAPPSLSVSPIVDAPRFAPTPVTVTVVDPDADPLTYRVQKGNAPSSLSATTRRTFIYQPLQPAPGFNGTDTLSFTATDSNGHSTTIPIPISMHDGAPTVACSTVFRAPGAAITDPTSLCAASDPDNDPTSMTIQSPVNGTIAPDGSFVPAAVGNASVTVVVSDGVLWNSTTLTVKVQNLTQPGTPSVQITSPRSPHTVVVGEEVRFDGTATDPSTPVRPTITWTFGDGGTQTGTTVYHAYSSTGSKVVTASIGGAEDRLFIQVLPRPIVIQAVRWLSLRTMKVTVTVGTGGSLSASLMRGSKKVGSATLKRAPALRKVTLTLHPKPIRGRGLVMLSLQLKGKQPATLRRALVVPAVAS